MGEVLETDVLIVGGGPAGLAAAIHFKELLKAHNLRSGKDPLEASVMVIEKASEFGAHNLSGAVLDPISLKELIPDFEAQDTPVKTRVSEDHVYMLTRKAKLPLPIVPPRSETTATTS